MTATITLNNECINSLDLSPATKVIENILAKGEIASCEQKLKFIFDYEKELGDPRELSQIPEVRLWFIRLDSLYPWLPFLLDWKTGEFIRYTAMLVPHQFSSKEGIEYNAEALEIFLMNKSFVLTNWLGQQEIPFRPRIHSMAKLLGYELDDVFFDIFDN